MVRKRKNNPNPSIAHSVAVIAEHVKIQTKILDRLENRQYEMNEMIAKNAAKVHEENKGIKETLKQYFRIIIALIAIVGALVGIKMGMGG